MFAEFKRFLLGGTLFTYLLNILRDRAPPNPFIDSHGLMPQPLLHPYWTGKLERKSASGILEACPVPTNIQFVSL